MKQITKYIENKDFSTTIINFIYQFKCNKEELMSLIMLCKLLNKTNKEYNSESEFYKEKLNRYIIDYSVINKSINDIYFIKISLYIPSKNIIKEDNLETSIKFLLDSIYKHNLKDLELFNKEKRLYIESLLNRYKDIGFISEKNLLDLLDKDCLFNKLKYSDIDNIKDLELNNVIDTYNKYIKDIKPYIFVSGNIDINKLDNIIDKYINKFDLTEPKLIKKYNKYYNNFDLIEKKDICKFHQSIVYLVYNVKYYEDEDYYKLYLLNLLLYSSSSDLLLKVLRKNNNLVYTAGSLPLLNNGLLIIKAMTNKNSINIVKLLIKELLNDLKDINKYKDNINNIIKRLELNKERELDYFYTTSSNYINKYFNTDKTLEEEIDIIKNIKLKEIKELLNRLVLICDYSLEGDM